MRAPISWRQMAVVKFVCIVAIALVTWWVLADQGAPGVDLAVRRHFAVAPRGVWHALVDVGDTPGTRVFYVVSVVVVALLGAWLDKRPLRLPIAISIVAIETAGLWLFKVGVGRSFPRSPAIRIHGDDQSFPSGHVANVALVCVLAVAWLVRPGWTRATRRWCVALAVFVVVVVSVCVLALRYHWLTDVLAGWPYGVLFGMGAVFLDDAIEGWRSRRLVTSTGRAAP